ncbi:hypothetical protein GCM10007854_20680 [Algimonas porphyrae]|uniref:Winged helix-turn-helix domain-containing protein n=2 Tax=Algimonas porphyrae TaxID=1128113 RepID=A0ABQ5V2N6_9PROT|nr:hypothetical protein GCM10007854_20680 [Algimonas porphyrae]
MVGVAMTPLRISNRTARWLWLDVQGLSPAPLGAPPLQETVSKLGYVQLDSICNLSRAHHHILWSRDQSYREADLHAYAYRDRGAFEHFSHDACLLPMSTYPMWARRFAQFRAKLDRSSWYATLPDANEPRNIRDRIGREGPLCSADFDHGQSPRPKAMWARPPIKLALDYMWYCGELSTAYRKGFQKYYDLTEHVIPETVRHTAVPDADQIDWLCHAAIDRLGYATPGDLKRFWEAVSTAEVRDWIARVTDDLVPVQVEGADGSWRHAFASASIEDRIALLTQPTSRLRVLNPFDPAIRDRKRLRFLFGFDYVNEIFVPKAKRRWGYYVYPVLEGDRMIARVDLSGGPKTGVRPIVQQWIEPGVRWSDRRQQRLEAEVARLSRLQD